MDPHIHACGGRVCLQGSQNMSKARWLIRTLLGQYGALSDQWEHHHQGLMQWWSALPADARRSVLVAASPDIREEFEPEQNLVPECCMSVLADKPCACARTGSSPHGPELRLLHDLHAAATMVKVDVQTK